MDNFTNNSSLSFVRWPVTFVQTLLLFVLTFGAANPAMADSGYPLINSLTGAFGDATEFLKSEVTRLVDDSGIAAAATQANDALTGFAEGAVPVIDDLANPYQEKAEDAVANALDKVKIATDILNKITGPGAEAAINYLRNSPLFAGADFGMSTPTGRIRIKVQGGEISLCRTVVGPLGSIIITGFSNAKNLCNFPDPRMSNPTKSLIAFTYIAAGHTHIRTSHVIVPNLAEDLTKLPAAIDATTYIKTIGGQLVQIRLAGADPASITMDAKFEVGLKANVSYYIDLEAETEAALSITDLKPLVAAEVIRSTGAVMFNKATALGLDIEVANLSSDAAAILQAGLDHLSDIEGNFGKELADGFGNVSIDVKLTTGIGLGFLDTAISLLSANSTFNLTAPLASFIEMSIDTPALLKEFLDSGLEMANVNMNLASAVLTGKNDALAGYKADMQAVSDAFMTGPLTSLLELTTKITSIESTFKLALLGDADKQSITLYESGIELPVGVLSTSLLNNTNPIGGAFEAMSYLMLSAINPTLDIPDQTWTDLEQVIVPDIKFTLRARNPITATLFGFKEADLLVTIKTAATIRDILVSVINSSVSESLNDLRAAIDKVVEDATNAADDVLIAWINNAKIERSLAIGTNASLGAEAVAEVGANIELKGHVSGSFFLLLADLDIYQKPGNDGLLSSASMPIEFSLDAGASAGEGLEVTVDAGGQLKFNAFELTVKHWDGILPTAALLKVAGFSVIEFNGTTNADGSFSGPGYLMMPMGGIVSADFSVDEFGNVTSGTWSGGLELGPLGNYPFIEGTIDNDGLHGTVNVGLLGSNFNANFIVHSSGLLLGSYDGDITIAGHELLAANLYLNADGDFIGHYNGDLSIGGFVATSELDFNNDGFTGSSALTIFKSGLTSTDVGITRSGEVSGTFTGEIVVGTEPNLHTLTGVTLQAVNGGFIGTALMDLPGLPGASVELRIFDGKVTAYYWGELFNGFVSQASFAISESGVVMGANFDASKFPNLSSGVLQLFINAASTAESGLQLAIDTLADADQAVIKAEIALNELSANLTEDLATAQQELIDAIENAQIALYNLKVVTDEIDALNNAYKTKLADALKLLNEAKIIYKNSVDLVAYYDRKIIALDKWYSGLSLYYKAKNSAYYTAQRLKLIGYRATARTARNLKKIALDAAQLAYDVLTSELADLLNPFELSKTGLQIASDEANDLLEQAQTNLDNIEIEISNLDNGILDSLRITLKEAQENLDQLQGTIALAGYSAVQGADGAFSVLAANVTVDLNTALNTSTLDIDAHIYYLGQQGQVSLIFDPADPVGSFQQLVTSLQTSTSTLSNNDVIAPTVVANQASEWIKDLSLVQLIAADNSNGSGVASITFSASGAQVISEVTYAGKEAFALINTEGLTTLNFFATDIRGNVSETTSITVNIDNSGPQISITPSGVINNVFEVIIKATDLLGSGIQYIAVSGSGAEPFSESIELTGEVVIALSKEGTTTLSITAIDLAGNTTTLSQDIIVPEIIPPNLGINGETITSDENTSSGGGALGLLWLMLFMTTVYLRRTPMKISRQE